MNKTIILLLVGAFFNLCVSQDIKDTTQEKGFSIYPSCNIGFGRVYSSDYNGNSLSGKVGVYLVPKRIKIGFNPNIGILQGANRITSDASSAVLNIGNYCTYYYGRTKRLGVMAGADLLYGLSVKNKIGHRFSLKAGFLYAPWIEISYQNIDKASFAVTAVYNLGLFFQKKPYTESDRSKGGITENDMYYSSGSGHVKDKKAHHDNIDDNGKRIREFIASIGIQYGFSKYGKLGQLGIVDLGILTKRDFYWGIYGEIPSPGLLIVLLKEKKRSDNFRTAIGGSIGNIWNMMTPGTHVIGEQKYEITGVHKIGGIESRFILGDKGHRLMLRAALIFGFDAYFTGEMTNITEKKLYPSISASIQFRKKRRNKS